MSSRREGENHSWRWPERGINVVSLVEEAKSRLTSPYASIPPAMCYPGSPLGALSDATTALAIRALIQNLNAIGTHTHGQWQDGVFVPEDGEGGFEGVHSLERESIWMVASMCGGEPEEIDGHFCNGGTEANIQGLWIAREALREMVKSSRSAAIEIFRTAMAHYCIDKGASLLDMDKSHVELCDKCNEKHIHVKNAGGGIRMIGMREDGGMDPQLLRKGLQNGYDAGVRMFIVVATAGTTALGSIDPIAEINAVVREFNDIHKDGDEKYRDAFCYMHVDASFGGFTIPFADPATKIGFENDQVISVALDAHKMGQMPYPCGIFLCRKKGPTGKDWQKFISREVPYIKGHSDSTLAGSRSSLPAILSWVHYRSIGVEGQRQYVQECLKHKEHLATMIADAFPEARNWDGNARVRIFPSPASVNILPLAIDFANDPDNLVLVQPYELRSDLVPIDLSDPTSCPQKVYKLCIMPHTFAHVSRFVDDLKASL